MNECTYLSTKYKELPENFDLESLSQFFEGNNPDRYIDQRERQLYAECSDNRAMFEAKYNMMIHRVEKARTLWACITAKSQRTKNFKYQNGCYYQVNTFSQMTEIKPKIERDRGIKPPERSGETIQKFTKRSRQRLMRKARTMNKGQMRIWDKNQQKRVTIKKSLPLPYFVTLTYHRNMKNPEQGKKDLNTFLQRFRRLSKYFAYVWKMEPQKRGAVHFHLAFFIPDEVFPAAWRGLRKLRVEWLRMRISAAWNEIAEPGDNTHLQAGTNVRTVDNWKQFLAYIFKYCGKEIDNPWKDMDTGRFWGFSYNLDFEALHIGFVDHEDLERINDFCNALNSVTFAQFLKHCIDNAKRARKNLKGKELYGRLRHIRNSYERQKRRFLINRDKIDKGYMLQFEINAEKAEDLRELLNYEPFRKN